MQKPTSCRPAATIELYPDVLEPIGPEYDPESRYLGTVIVERALCHLELLEVVEDDQHGQVARHPEYEDILTHHFLAAGADRPFSTVKLNGREYVVLIDPYCQ